MGLFQRTAYSPLPKIRGDLPLEDIETIAASTERGSHSHLALDIPVDSSFDREIGLLADNSARQKDYRTLMASKSIFKLLVGDFSNFLAPRHSAAVAVIDIHHGDLSKVITHANDWHSDIAIGDNTLVGTVATESPTEWLCGDYTQRKGRIIPDQRATIHTFETTDEDTRPLLSIRDFNIHRRSEDPDPNRIFIVAGLLLTSS